MSQLPGDFSNPYAAPKPTAPSLVAGAKPGFLTAVCVIAIVFGILGAMAGLWGVGAVIFGEAINEAVMQASAGPGVPPAQQEYTRNAMAVNRRFMLPQLGVAVISLAASIGLTLGGFLGVKMPPSGRNMLAISHWISVAAILIGTVVWWIQTMQMAPVLNEFMTKIGPGGNDPGAKFAATAGQVGMYASVAIGSVFALAKAAYFAFGALYLQKPAVKAYYGE